VNSVLLLAGVGDRRYAPAVEPLETCPDCGAVWYRSHLPGLDVMMFDEPPHRLLTWRCSCGVELCAWTDREGNRVGADGGPVQSGQ
jgi:hypothetical protein